MKKEEEFLKSCIEDSFRPLFSGVREFTASNGFKEFQGFPVKLQDFSTPFRTFRGLFALKFLEVS